MHQHLAVLGSPIAHSRSPRIHRAAYAALGLPWEYEAIDCVESDLHALLDSRDETWRGFSVTMPLKVQAHRLSSVIDPVATESGVVNTLLRLAGNAGWAGFNTDVAGLAAALSEAELEVHHTVVLGAGATAVSAVLAARRLGAAKLTVLARRPDAARELQERFGDAGDMELGWQTLGDPRTEALDPTLIISTLPGAAGSALVLPEALVRAPLFDVAYDPWPSALAEQWRTEGGVVHSGLGMLLHQARYQLRVFVGGDPEVPVERETEAFEAMRAAVI